MAVHIDVVLVDYEPATGLIDLADLKAKLSAGPRRSISRPRPISASSRRRGGDRAHRQADGAETIVGVDPISLGIARAAGGLRRRHRGGHDAAAWRAHELRRRGRAASSPRATRCATRANIRRCPGPSPRRRARRVRLRHALVHQTSYGSREKGKDWTGNSTYLWAIANAVYMALMGRRASARSAS